MCPCTAEEAVGAGVAAEGAEAMGAVATEERAGVGDTAVEVAAPAVGVAATTGAVEAGVAAALPVVVVTPGRLFREQTPRPMLHKAQA